MDLYYNKTMKRALRSNRIIAVVLAAVITVCSLAACGNAKTTVVNRKVETNRGTGFHSTL